MKYCCEALEENSCAFERTFNFSTLKIDGPWQISTSEDHWYTLDDVVYCPWCGKELRDDE